LNMSKSNPRILIISQHFPPEKSGNASRIYDLSKNLVELGVKVTILSPFPTFPHGSYKKIWKIYSHRKINDIDHINIFDWQPVINDPSFISRMGYYLIFPIHAIFWALLKRKDYDAIISSAPPIFTGITGYFIKKITRKKWFFDVRDLWIDASVSLDFIKKDSSFEKISRKYERICYDACDTILVTTEGVKKIIGLTYKISPDKIEIVPNGVDTKTFRSLKEKKNRVIYAGNIGHAQDLDKVILAVKKINEKIPLEFYLIGDGDTKKDLEKLVKKEGLSETVIFTGLLEREQIPDLISESLIGVAPLKNLDSLRYAIPTKTYEYMSCGIPFVGTGGGEIENLAKISKAGVMAKNNVNSIYDKMMNILEDKEMMAEMGRNGREFVENFYDRKKIAEKLLCILRQ